MTTSTIKVAIGIASYNRHIGLLRLLRSINNLKYETNIYLKVIIVDNSLDFNCKELLNEKYKFEYLLIHEKKPGIPYARNRVVKESENFDFIAFLDDDEVVEPNWLEQLLRTQEKYKADVVTGPVLPIFEKEPKIWNIAHQTRTRFLTGTPKLSFGTGNVILKSEILQDILGPFDIRLAHTGGTDSLLASNLIKKGYSIIWCNEAIVKEYVPKSRMKLTWIIQRAFRGGNNYSLRLKILNSSYQKLFLRFLKSLLKLLFGIFLLPLIIIPCKYQFKGILLMSESLGSFLGLLNYSYKEYLRNDIVAFPKNRTV